jgi:hypothetical protein
MEIDIPIITKGEKVILLLKLIRTREIIGLFTEIIKITVGEAIVTMTQIKVRETIISRIHGPELDSSRTAHNSKHK